MGCGSWKWYRGVGIIHMNRGRVGEERGGKKMDRCPLTLSPDSEMTMRRQYLIGLSTYLSHLPIDKKAFSAPFRSVQQANCAVQPTASEGGNSTVSTVSVAEMHTPIAHQCTRMDEHKCSVRGGEECAHVASTSTERLAIGIAHPMMQTIGALIPDHVSHNVHAYTTPPVPQHPERGTHI
jgi:hypothetical protein